MFNKRIIIDFTSYLIFLLPLALLTGPALPDIFISLVSIIFIYLSFLDKDYRYYNNFFFKFFALFYFYLILSSVLSENIIFSMKSSIFYFRFVILSLAIWYLIENKKNFIDIFFYFLLGAYLLALFSGTYEYFFSETILGKPSISNRLLLLTSDNLLLGQYLSRIFPLIVAFYVYKMSPNLKNYIFLFFIFIATDILTYLSGERTALGLLFISSVFILFLVKKLRLFRLVTIIAPILIIILISYFNTTIKERNVDHTLNQLGMSKGSEKIYLFSPIHENYYLSSWRMFQKNMITGIGPNNYRNECKKDDYISDLNPCSTHPHNNYVQLLAELGIIGIFFIIFIIYFVSNLIVKHIYYNTKGINYLSDYQVCLIACIFCSIWPFLPTMNLFNNWINIIYFLPIGFFLQSYLRNKSLTL